MIVICVICLILIGFSAIQEMHRVHQREAAEDRKAELYLVTLHMAIYSFRTEYHEWPGPAGKINDSFICELQGRPDAKINLKHINFYAQYNSKIMKANRFGFEFEFYPAKAPSEQFVVGTPSRDPRTGLPSTLFSMP
jgi:hypothetical protein